jgi:hypothetical protein
MIERVMDRFGLYPERLAGDSAYDAYTCPAGRILRRAGAR